MALSLYTAKIPPERYNHFFNPNLCHVCKYKVQTDLKLCSDCSMISYCSEEHRLQHRTQHKEICEAIKEISKTKCLWITRGMTNDEWVKHKKENLQAIKEILCRKLEPYEEQMFLFAKSCRICHQQRDVKLVCIKCWQLNWCDDHQYSPVTHDCEQLEQSLLLDIYEFLEKEDVRIPLINLPDSMTHIVESGSTKAIVDRFVKNVHPEYLKWKFIDYMYSNAMSGPLTVLHTINRVNPLLLLNQQETYVLHIIAGSLTDKQSLSAWEMALHIVLPSKKILIIMIESELKIDEEDIGEWDVCIVCQAMKNTLTFQVHNMSYESYVQSSSYVPPDVIIGFNVDVKELEADTIKILQRQECLVLLTFTSQHEMYEIILEIHMVLEMRPDHFGNMRNKFQSHRPYKDIKEDTFFPNMYMLYFM
ncbi:uncharacterized protein LOC116846893 isoform X2 [Odontomachus brunneus]|uniref:uncharacterized protein LOC116846893 isoform X1 n=1 Tax=Odontomachus brunneus TaxID=486640 RepID=UPI0013F2430F|nr:uncharacterized protein LOC116846893 isoform X1 [Odontomachus brunneus]XP_032677177.1 uncharacterized protein LOC116846893 isoform X2 [Odontomachus brunneus]